MSLTGRIADVRVAQLRVLRARMQLQQATDGLLAGTREHPLTTVSLAAGAGAVLGALRLPAIRVPGMAGLLATGAAEGVALGARLLAEFAVTDLARRPAPDVAEPTAAAATSRPMASDAVA